MQPQIEHVSDTALMVAGSRALESRRADALVKDPFAERLAGERGMALATNTPRAPLMQFGIGVRSRFIDEMLSVAFSRGIDTVLNLGAGLDTRPWRLDLPAGVCWIEVDFPAMLEYKKQHLAGVAARCDLEQLSADLNDREERAAVLDRAAAAGRSPLIMTEGVLMYLPAATVEALAADAQARGFRFWLFDVSSPELMRAAHGDMAESINRVRAETHLSAREILDVPERNGWSVAERRTYLKDGTPLAFPRLAELRVDPNAPPPPADEVSGVWLYQA